MIEGNGEAFGSGKTIAHCSICGTVYVGYGNNAQPVNNGRCCDKCNQNKVIPTRMKRMREGKNPYGD